MKEQILIFTKERRAIRQKSRCLSHLSERNFPSTHVNIQMNGQIKDSWKGGSYV